MSRYALLWTVPLLLSLAVALAPPPTAAQGPASRSDIILLIDDSGSMKGNDPDGLRWSGAQLAVDLARPGDRLAVVAFATQATPLGDATQGRLTPIGAPGSSQALKQHLAPHPGEGTTNMRDGLHLALELLAENPGANRPAVLLLTDGRPEPEDQRPEVERLVAQAASRGVPLFPVLLGTAVDRPLAEGMASTTGGLVQSVNDPVALLEAYGRLYSFLEPERYVDPLPLAAGQSVATLRTNPDQAVLGLTLVVPHAQGERALLDLSWDGASLLGRTTLPGGAALVESQGPHYSLVAIHHNTPLTGEWVAALSAGGRTLLAVAEAATTVELLYPQAASGASLVAPRRYPAGKPLLLIAAVRREGGRIADARLMARFGEHLVPLSAEGFDPNRILYGAEVELGRPAAGTRTQVEVQVGAEQTPVRLRKTFVLEAADVPRLVADSPTPAQPGLSPAGTLRLAAHFEGPTPSAPQVVALIHDLTEGTVTRIELRCEGPQCADESLTPTPGHDVRILFIGTARVEGQPFTDWDRGELHMGEQVVIALARTNLGDLLPGLNPQPVGLTITPYTRRPWSLTATDVTLAPPLPGVTPQVLIGPPQAEEAGRFRTTLEVRGLENLPPDDYILTVHLSAGEEIAVAPQDSLTLAWRVLRPGVTLDLPSPLELGEVVDLTRPQSCPFRATVSPDVPVELRAAVERLEDRRGMADPDLIRVDLTRLSPTASPGVYEAALRLSGLQPLPPGPYRAWVRFTAADGQTEVRPATIILTFEVPQPYLALDLPSPLELGEVVDLTRPQGHAFRATVSPDVPVELRATVERLEDRRGMADPDLIRVDLTRFSPTPSPGVYKAALRLSGLQPLPPGSYRAWVRFTAADGQMEVRPGAIIVTFEVPQPYLALVEPTQVDFGAALRLDKLREVELILEPHWLSGTPLVMARVQEAHREPGGQEVTADFEATTLFPEVRSDGRLCIRLSLRARRGVGRGTVKGKLALGTAEGTPVEPGEIPFRLRKLAWWEYVWYRLEPARRFLYAWFWPQWPLPWRAAVSWGTVLLLASFFWGQARPPARGRVRCQETGAVAEVRPRRPVAILFEGARPLLSTGRAERRRAVALVTVEEAQREAVRRRERARPGRRPGEGRRTRRRVRPQVVLRPGPLARPHQVRHADAMGRWQVLKGPLPLRRGQRFQVQGPDDGRRFHFRYTGR